MSQEKLGDALGLTFQQVQKYERGTNRVGSSRLFQISRILNVPVSFFFDDMVEGIEAGMPGMAEAAASYEADPMTKRETLELARAYHRIKDPVVRKRLFELAKSLAAASSEKT